MANLSNAIKALDSISGGKKIRADKKVTVADVTKALKSIAPSLKFKKIEDATDDKDSSYFFLVVTDAIPDGKTFVKFKEKNSKELNNKYKMSFGGFQKGLGFYISGGSREVETKVKAPDSYADKIAKSIQKETDDFDVSYTGYKEFGECIFLFKFKGANINTFLREHSGPGGGLKGYLDRFFDHLGTIKGIETKGKEIYVNVEF